MLLGRRIQKTMINYRRTFFKVFENTRHTEEYLKSCMKYPQELFSLINSQVNSSFGALDEETKKRYGKSEDGKWPQALDVGCAHGNTSAPLLQYFKKVLGVDASQTQIDLATKEHGKNDNLKFLKADAACVSQLLPENSTDLVSSRLAVHWFDQSKFFRESFKYLDTLAVGEMKPVFEALRDNYASYEPELKSLFGSVERNESLGIETVMSVEEYASYLLSWPPHASYIEQNSHLPAPVDHYIEKLSSKHKLGKIPYKARFHCLFCTKTSVTR